MNIDEWSSLARRAQCWCGGVDDHWQSRQSPAKELLIVTVTELPSTLLNAFPHLLGLAHLSAHTLNLSSCPIFPSSSPLSTSPSLLSPVDTITQTQITRYLLPPVLPASAPNHKRSHSSANKSQISSTHTGNLIHIPSVAPNERHQVVVVGSQKKSRFTMATDSPY